MGITGHFILDWEMKFVTLSCKRFKGKYTAENIRHEYEETLAIYDISDKIFAVVTDNASNMVKAIKFSLPGYTIEEAFDKDEPEESEGESDNEEEDSYYDTNEEAVFDHLPKHSRCCAHTLQLVVKDGLKHCNAHLITFIAKASKIVNFVRKSIPLVHASTILEDENRSQASNVTRWNSQLKMIRSILKVPEEKLNKIEYTLKLNAYERRVFKELSKSHSWPI